MQSKCALVCPAVLRLRWPNGTNRVLGRLWLAAAGLLLACAGLARADSARVPQPAAAAAPSPDRFQVRLETTKGDIVIDVHRDWAPRGTDRFYQLVRAGYYDDVAFSRVIAGQWAQFGINGDPRVSNEWRTRTIPDDPFKESNVRGTVAFAFAVPNGRTTQVFINLRDNRVTHDKEPFVPFGRVLEGGMEVADRLYSGYGESAGSGIRSGKQGPLFEGGNAYLRKMFPLLDYIRRARVEPSPAPVR
jgi:cyclophilin family peptidyl-prolyl cis-trans isomerase